MRTCPLRRDTSEHYTSPERLSPHFSDDWTIQLTLRTGQFTELPRIGRPRPHVPRMGALPATRTSSVTTERA